jgi:parvulin-like peptidyl-prolyl isomerase
MEDGEISSVVETEYGYHIFQMISLTDANATAENKATLAKEADDEYFNNLITSWISDMDEDYTYSKRVNDEVYNLIEFK